MFYTWKLSPDKKVFGCRSMWNILIESYVCSAFMKKCYTVNDSEFYIRAFL